MSDHRFSRGWRWLAPGAIAWCRGLWLRLTLADLSFPDFPDRSLAVTTIVPAPSSTTTTSAASAFAFLTIAVARCSDAM